MQTHPPLAALLAPCTALDTTLDATAPDTAPATLPCTSPIFPDVTAFCSSVAIMPPPANGAAWPPLGAGAGALPPALGGPPVKVPSFCSRELSRGLLEDREDATCSGS